MSIKWTGCEAGILRKSEFKEKKEDLFVFGYSCKLFRDDGKAQHIDQGKHLIPWMGDESLKIDRYDARGALHELASLEAPSGGYDWRMELTKGELDVEQLCDEERYRALYTNEDEEEMYKEEELKRLHAAGYGQVGFNYETPTEPTPVVQPVEIDEPFLPTASYKALFSADIVLPESQKQNAIIEKTATFIAHQGAQMEILIKTKQGDNPQFKFLNRDNNLHPYYTTLIGLVKTGKWPEKQQPEIIEEKPSEPNEYLHPSLASTVIESAPSIPSIHYKPSADCDYTMLISKMRGEATLDEVYAPELAPGEVAPPGTEPLPPRATAEISRAPVMYNRPGEVVQAVEQLSPAIQAHYEQYAAYYAQYAPQPVPAQPPPKPVQKIEEPTTLKSTGLSLMKNYNTDSESDDSDFDDSSSSESKDPPPILKPPEDVQVVIDKMAAYVARNGDEFAEIVRAKNDPRFTFLEPDNVYHMYYKRLMQQKRGGEVNGAGKDKGKSSVPVSFSIKKLKEPDPILPKPALPYESSSDEDSEKQTDKQEDKEPTKVNPPPIFPLTNMPPVVVYKMESQLNNELPTVKQTIEPVKPIIIKPAPIIIPEVKEIPKTPKIEEIVVIKPENHVQKEEVVDVKKEVPSEEKKVPFEEKKVPFEDKKVPLEEKKEERKKESESRERDRVSPKVDKRKHRERKKDYRSKSETRERESKRVDKRSVEKSKEKKKEVEEKKRKYSKDELENEIISLEDNSDDLIDLTGDVSDSKGEVERAKKEERRRRAAEFLKKVGVDPSAAALPTNSLASAMVDTLESLRKKKADEEKRRRREQRRHRSKYDYEDGCEKSHRKSKRRKYRSSDEEDSDYDGTKRKKHKRDRKHISSKSKKKRRRENDVEEDQPLNIDLTSTLKELRTASPTKELVQDIDDATQHSSQVKHDSSSEDLEEEKGSRKRKKKKEDREYSEGEWSSDSEEDSESSHSKKVE